jgi:hypothetical protein
LLPEALDGLLGVEPRYVQIRQSPDPWNIAFDHAVGRKGVPGGWNLNAAAGRLDGPEIAEFRPRRVLKIPGHFQLVGEGRLHDRTVRAEFYLIGPEPDPRAQLTLADPVSDDKAPQIIQTDSFSQLLSKYPREVRRYVCPLLDAIAGRRVIKPAAADIYRAFASIQPDEKAMAEVKPLVAELGAPQVSRRNAASGKLAEIGAPAVLVLLRMDRESLSPEQQSRVTKFIAENTTGIAPEAARKDQLFLIDAMCDDDRLVRAAAKTALEDLRGQPVDFDLDQSPAMRAEAADRLLESVVEPTTRP